MSYKQIDKQFDEMFGFNPCYVDGRKAYLVNPAEVKSFLHQIYDQAKAEQREIDAGIVDSFGFANKTLKEKYNELIGNVEIDREGDSYKNGFNQASKVIATAIRQEWK